MSNATSAGIVKKNISKCGSVYLRTIIYTIRHQNEDDAAQELVGVAPGFYCCSLEL